MELVVASMDRPPIAGVQSRMNRAIQLFTVSTTLFAVLALAGCGNSLELRDVPTPRPPEPTPAPRELSLPADDGSHSAPIEWWYYNGHLTSDDGKEYSFHYVVFQTQSNDTASPIEFGQAGITDINRAEHTYISSDRIASSQDVNKEDSGNLLNLHLANFTLKISADGTHILKASDESGASRLELATEIPSDVMLHDGIGWMDWPFGWTYYYSYPRIKAAGTLTIEGRNVDVKGEMWFDHQWGDFFVVGKPAGWQWFAIHLDDGRSLMVSEVRGADGDVLATEGTLSETGYEQRVLDVDKDGITLEVQEHWTSPHTAGEYPSRWRLQVTSIDLDITMLASIADQEVPAMPYGNQAAAYWEGRVDVIDTASGESLGRAFAELSGYVEPEPLIWHDAAP